MVSDVRVDFLRGGFSDVAVLGIVVADIQIEVALFASEVKAADSSRVDDLPVGRVELLEERVVNDNAEASRSLRRGVVV